MVQHHDRSPQGERLGDAQARLFVEGRMDQHPRAGELRDEIGSADPTLEAHTIPEAPCSRGRLEARLLRTVSEEAE